MTKQLQPRRGQGAGRKQPVTEPTTGRFTARMPPSTIDIVRRAAELEGATMNQFVAQASLHAAQKVIEEHTLIRLTLEESQRFYDAINSKDRSVPPAFAAAAERYKARYANRKTQSKA